MKKIIIVYKNSSHLTLTDEDSTDLRVYTKELTKIMELSKICILETSDCNVIIRPSEISSILVKDTKSIKDESLEKKIFNKEDIIKDM